MVLALDVIPRLVNESHLSFRQICHTMATLAQKWLVAEFIAPTSREAHHGDAEAKPWYTLENFSAELERHFRSVDHFPLDTEHHVLLLCAK